jgi:hypothetical protein
MLSYKTILAIQVLFLLNRADERGLTIADLKYEARLNATGIGHAVRQLCKRSWLVPGTKYRYTIAEDVKTRTLYDLVVVMDETVLLSQYVNREYVPYWGATAKEHIPHVVSFNEMLSLQFSQMLLSIKLKEIITGEELPGGILKRSV